MIGGDSAMHPVRGELSARVASKSRLQISHASGAVTAAAAFELELGANLRHER